MNKSSSLEPQKMLSKVPEVTIFFWIIKILCTTVGETAADFLDVSLGLGLDGTSIVMGILLTFSLILQYKVKKYVPGIYWLTVVMISVFGTLVTDNLTDKLGVPLEISTAFFSVALALTFGVWYAWEKTLSIHSIFTIRRESFYWLAILFTFALGTASGDLMAESLGLGYLLTGIIVCSVVAAMTIGWKLGLNPVLSFWVAYIMTRPLGASIGDYLSQSHASGGLGFGPTITSAIFLTAILFTVIYLSATKRDQIASQKIVTDAAGTRKGSFFQVATVISILVIAAGLGYKWRHAKLQAASTNVVIVSNSKLSQSVKEISLPLGDLSKFKIIADNSLTLVHSGKFSDAKTRIGDLEYAWDNAEAQLKPMNKEAWRDVDKSIDVVLRKLRSVNQDSIACSTALESFISVLGKVDPQNCGNKCKDSTTKN